MASQNREVLRRLKSDHYLDNIGLLFKTLYSNDNLADVTISCRDGSIEAHKIVLSACSSYFHELLSKKTPHPVFIMHKISIQDMLYLLEFMYKGVIDVPEDIVDRLVKIARELEITDFGLPLPESNSRQKIIQSTYKINAKKRKAIQIENPDMIDLEERDINVVDDDFMLTNSQKNRYSSISERSNSDANDNPLGRNTRFKGKKRVPVSEIESADSLQTSPSSRIAIGKKKLNSPNKNNIIHSTPATNNDGLSNFVIKDVSGANGSIVLSYTHGGKNSKPSGSKGQPTPVETPVLKKNIEPLKSKSKIEEISPTLSDDVLNVTSDLNISVDVMSDEENDTKNNSLMTNNLQPVVHVEPLPTLKIKTEPKAKFKCDLCKKRFVRASHLVKHKKNHVGPLRILFPCKKCDEKFTRLDKLKIHVQNYHDDDDYIPKGEKKKRLYGNPIEASPIELQQIERNNNPTSVTQSIIQSIKDISSTTTSGETTGNNTSSRSETTNSEKRKRGRPRKEKGHIIKTPRRPIGRPRKYQGGLKPKERRPVGRPRKNDSPIKIKIIGGKRGRPRKSVSTFDGSQSSKTPNIKSDNYDGASLPYGDLSYLTSGFITPELNQIDDDPLSSSMYNNSLSVGSESLCRPTTVGIEQPPPPPVTSESNGLMIPENVMTMMPPIKSECHTTITPVNTPPPPSISVPIPKLPVPPLAPVGPIIPFQNENITITQISPPPLVYIKALETLSTIVASPSVATISTATSGVKTKTTTISEKKVVVTPAASTSKVEDESPLNIKVDDSDDAIKIGEVTIRPVTNI